MGTTQQRSAGGGFFSKLIVVALLALTVALYLRIVMVEGDSQGVAQPVPEASVRVLEGDEPAPRDQALAELPKAQMDLILQVFAPEMLEQ
jgi:hypothetical protein